jgi:hypothetical protein
MAFATPFAATQPFAASSSLLDGRITFEPSPDWVDEFDFDAAATRWQEEPLTCLLHSEQLHAEKNACHTRIVLRLESMLAVQHFSQWRLDFDPLTQRLALHTLRVRRGDAITEHADPARIRLLQREEGMESFVLHGHYTLVTLFEDVRPGDCLEVAYTVTQIPRLLGGSFHRLLFLPTNHALDRYVWSVLHHPERGLRHLESPTLGAPEIEDAGPKAPGLVRWTWKGTLRERPAPESNTPPWHLADHWVQLSDLPDWGTVAAGFAAAWPAPAESDLITQKVRMVEASASTLEARIEFALRLVQDDFRYLSVNLELGGHIPADPAEVLRRRFGDCKDLTLLLCRVLNLLGVKARPLLVHSALGPRLPDMLPSPGLFNHAIVELTLDGEIRWIDATGRAQGGGPRGRSLAPYGFALPVDHAAGSLLAQPAAPAADAVAQEINETILLDTRGGSSILRVRQILSGRHADNVRRQIETGGLQNYRREREKLFAARYGEADTDTPFTHDDDRDRNLMRTMEVYRVRGFVDLNRGGGRCAVNLPPSFALLALARPAPGERREDWFLNHPLRMEHTVDVVATPFQPLPFIGQTFADKAVILVLKRKFLRARWLQSVSLTTNLATLPAEQVKIHSQVLESAWSQCSWIIMAFAGLGRPHRKHGFFEPLPLSASLSRSPFTSTQSATPFNAAEGDTPEAENARPAPSPATAKRRNSERRTKKRIRTFNPWLWPVIGFGIAAATTAYLYYKHR